MEDVTSLDHTDEGHYVSSIRPLSSRHEKGATIDRYD